MAARAVVVNGPGQARAAARAAADLAPTTPLALVSAENGAVSGGPGWFLGVLSAAQAAAPEVTISGSLRCGGAPGLALAALRCGLTEIELDRAHPAYDRVRAIAGKMGARLVDVSTWQLLDLGAADGARAEELVREWIVP